MSLKLDYNIKQTKKIFSLLLLFGSLSHFVFIPFTAVKCFSPICYFLLNFLLDFFYFLNILLCCLRVWVESSCQKSSFDSFKCLTSSPNFCSFSFIIHPLPQKFCAASKDFFFFWWGGSGSKDLPLPILSPLHPVHRTTMEKER